MRRRAYFAFELMAWPAAVWSAVEIGLRAATGTSGGAAATALTGACAAATIVLCRWRTAMLAPQGSEALSLDRRR
jgi:hypothetical protein